MNKQCITAEAAPAALGPYSHAVRTGNLLYLSGQGSFTTDGIVKGTLEEETHQTFANIKAVLEAANLTLSDVVKTLVFLDDMDKFKAFNAVYKEYFPENPPARSCVEAARLPGDIQVEIEVIAAFPEA
ncbi:MAG: Rid family detoxifying hydrolase [Candidatus Hydrogenedentota bacterium]